MRSQIEKFKEEFERCTNCFMLFCEDNVNENGDLSEEIVVEALEGFITNIEIAYQISLSKE